MLFEWFDDYFKFNMMKLLLCFVIGESLFIVEGVYWCWQWCVVVLVFLYCNVMNFVFIMIWVVENVCVWIEVQEFKVVNFYIEMVWVIFDVMFDVMFLGKSDIDF